MQPPFQVDPQVVVQGQPQPQEHQQGHQPMSQQQVEQPMSQQKFQQVEQQAQCAEQQALLIANIKKQPHIDILKTEEKCCCWGRHIWLIIVGLFYGLGCVWNLGCAYLSPSGNPYTQWTIPVITFMNMIMAFVGGCASWPGLTRLEISWRMQIVGLAYTTTYLILRVISISLYPIGTSLKYTLVFAECLVKGPVVVTFIFGYWITRELIRIRQKAKTLESEVTMPSAGFPEYGSPAPNDVYNSATYNSTTPAQYAGNFNPVGGYGRPQPQFAPPQPPFAPPQPQFAPPQPEYGAAYGTIPHVSEQHV